MQLVRCLTADPGVTSSISAQSHTFAEIDHEVISMAILLPSADSRKDVSYKRKYVYEVLVNCLVKLAQEKSVVRWTDQPDMTIAVDWDAKNQTKQTIIVLAIKNIYRYKLLQSLSTWFVHVEYIKSPAW